MTNFYFPFPITEIENGALLYYFIFSPDWENKTNKKFGKKTEKIIDQIKYQFVSYENQNYCLFNDIYAVPLDLFEKLDLKTQKFLYFMKYSPDSPYSEVIFVFEIDEEFMINYKAYQTFLLEYKKRLELEKNFNENVEKTSEENSLKSEENTEPVLN
jgi:hypothetical protein